MALLPLLVSRQCAAELIGLSLRSVDYLLARGEAQGGLTAKKVGRRTLITRASLEKFCRSDRSVPITQGREGAEAQ